MMQAFLALLEGATAYRTLRERLAEGRGTYWLAGLVGAARSYLIAGLYRQLRGQMLLVTASIERAEEWYADLTALLGAEGRGGVWVRLFPSLETLLYEDVAVDRDLVGQRLATLEALLQGTAMIVVVPLSALLHRTIPRQDLEGTELTLRVGQRLEPDDLTAQLVQLGYERRNMVLVPGQFSARGGIVDVYPMTAARPLRVEFFGDEIESLRTFEVNSQRSLGLQNSFTITVSREAIHQRVAGSAGLEAIRAALEEQEAELYAAGADLAARRLRGKVTEDLRRLAAGEFFDGMEHYLPYLYPHFATLLDYLEPAARVVVDDPVHLAARAQQLAAEVERVYTAKVERGAALKLPGALYLPFSPHEPPWQGHPTLYLTPGPEPFPAAPPEMLSLPSQAIPEFQGDLDLLVQYLGTLRQERWRVLATTNQSRRLQQILVGRQLAGVFLSEGDDVPQPGQIQISPHRLSRGFQVPDLQLAVLADSDIFGWHKPRRATGRRDTALSSTALTAFTELQPGDYVVHVNHGIGRYAGLETKVINGVARDYLAIDYAGTDRLYVPVTEVDRVQKYIGADGHDPPLHRLSDRQWQRTRRRVRESAEKVAQELLELYARRQASEGFAFSPDTPWQEQMEASFIYEETPDQLQALAEVKEDMQTPRPMDRLICGDVGYGKTEVAIRAAFKACQDGKQVAVLVPTTVLAQQHYHTFRERLSAYPVHIEMLSRFRSRREQEKVVEGLRTGRVDIVIGTHRLIQPDVAFKNLGLLVIDEEQRFGVHHKERLKQLRTEVDVLTMTATPIPRTLQASLIGVRDMSLISDPPQGRMPIQTYLVERDEEIVREAILRELDRDGQVYFVHNRVQSIGRVKQWLQGLVPSARIAIGHGQLAEHELEDVMLDFFAGRYDILVCTTIIESGLDIPNVNTILIDDCDRFGLAQLYQLRGRVGRSTRQAYAFLLYRPQKEFTPSAQRRLEAIRELTGLGSGFLLALRDLEIRGAGNLLGPEQHGFMMEVGFEMYTQLLRDAVHLLQGKPVESRLPVRVDLPVEAYLPEFYVPDPSQRIDLYRRLAAAGNAEALQDLEGEMRDRFGPLPGPVGNLLRLLHLQVTCRQAGVESLFVDEEDRSLLQFLFRPDHRLDPRELRPFARALVGTLPAAQAAPSRLLRDRLLVWVPRRTPERILRTAEEWAHRLRQVRSGR
jgi:transcription-repair coupling factor (superfamily II helicase)